MFAVLSTAHVCRQTFVIVYLFVQTRKNCLGLNTCTVHKAYNIESDNLNFLI